MGEGHVLDDASTFLDREDLVGGDVVEVLLRAAGPGDLEAVRASGLAEAEVHPEIVLSQVARAGLHLALLSSRAQRDRKSRTERTAVTLAYHHSHDQRVTPAGPERSRSIVDEEVGGAAVVGDQQIEVA